MTISISKVQLIRCELKDSNSKWGKKRRVYIISDSFNVGPICFALFFTFDGYMYTNPYGVVLKDLAGKQSVEVSLKLWFENKEGQMFYQQPFRKYKFNKVGDQCQFRMDTSSDDWHLYCNARKYWDSLHICCELTDLNYRTTVSITDSAQFHQNTCSAYDENLHDAIIKVNGTKFKILKSQFMAHSEFFKNMFTLNFKERETSIVEAKDVSEKTMKQLINWMYTCRIEDESVLEDLYEVADKYQVHLLKTNCSELMINSLDNSNVFRRLILAVAHEDNQLKDFALDYIERMSEIEIGSYLTSPEWFELGQKKSVFAIEVNKLINDKLKK